MTKRGPKPSDPQNSAAKTLRLPGPYEPSSPLKARARREFDRLVSLLRRRGTIDRVDVGTITEAARIKAMLDQEHARRDADDRKIVRLTNCRRGLMRELGLALQSSRANYKANPGHSDGLRGQFAHLLGERS